MSNELPKILLVEDDFTLCEIAKISLCDVGKFEVETCNGGQECLDIVTQYKPDLILLDVVMPGMDGPTTLKELRKIKGFEKTVVIFLTAKVHPDEVAMLKTLSVKGVLSKPFNPVTLADEIISIYNS